MSSIRSSNNSKLHLNFLHQYHVKHSHPVFSKKFHFTISKTILSIITYYFTTHLTSQILFSYTTY